MTTHSKKCSGILFRVVVQWCLLFQFQHKKNSSQSFPDRAQRLPEESSSFMVYICIYIRFIHHELVVVSWYSPSHCLTICNPVAASGFFHWYTGKFLVRSSMLR